MELSDEEHCWALNIQKAMMETNATLAASFTDFEYAQHALIAKDKIPKALKRLEHLHAFCTSYNIPPLSSPKDTAEHAMQFIQELGALSPGMFLSFGKGDTITERYVITWDYSAFNPSDYHPKKDTNNKSTDNDNKNAWKVLFAGMYYLLDAMQPNFEAVRSGIVMLADAEHIGWKNFSLEIEKHAAHLYQDAYPIRIHNMTILHPPVIFKAMYALCKPVLSRKIKDSIHLNATLHDIQQEYPKECITTTMGGTQTQLDMEKELLEALTRRYSNMASFSL